jgi:hypothetical protein
MSPTMLWRNCSGESVTFGETREISMKPKILTTALTALGLSLSLSLSLSCSSAWAGWDDSYLPDCCAFWVGPWASGPAAYYPHRWYRSHRVYRYAHYRRHRVKMRDNSR